MAAVVDRRPNQNGTDLNRPRRMLPIVPVIPRALERKFKNLTCNGRSHPLLVRNQAEKAADDSPRSDKLVEGLNAPIDVLEKCEEVNKKVEDGAKAETKEIEPADPKKSVIQPGQDHSGFPMPDTLSASQRLQHEHGGLQPSPLSYPSDGVAVLSNLHSESASSPSQLRDPSADGPINEDTQGDRTQEIFTGPPSFYTSHTPPFDKIQSPSESHYQGYGHQAYNGFQNQYTPPTDSISSPIGFPSGTEKTYSSTSSDVQQNISADMRLGFPNSFYQGYTYSLARLNPSSPSESQPFQRDVTQYDLNTSLSAEEASASPSLNPAVKSQPSYDTLTNLLGSEGARVDTVIDFPPSEQAQYESDDSERGAFSNFNDRREGSSEHSLGSELGPIQTIDHKAIFESSVPARNLEYETWRCAVMRSLNQIVAGVSSYQFTLTDHLLQCFNVDEYSDYHLVVEHEKDKWVAEFRLHSLVLSNCSAWKELEKASSVGQDGKKSLKVLTKNKFLTPQAIQAALRVCYGESPLLFIGSPLHVDPSQNTREVSATWMKNALAFAAAGYLFRIDAVISRGLQIVSRILNWENIDRALIFILFGGLHLDNILSSDLPVKMFSTSSSSSENLNAAATASSNDTMDPKDCDFASKSEMFSWDMHQRTPSSELLCHCLDFIVTNFPESWSLDTSARPLTDINKLPTPSENRPPSNKLRLSQIQFGDHPSENATKASAENVVLSSIILSLPFVLVKYILERIEGPMRDRSMISVVDERERRRSQGLKTGKTPSNQGRPEADHQTNAEWEEYVVLDQCSRLTLQRKWVNSHQPY